MRNGYFLMLSAVLRLLIGQQKMGIGERCCQIGISTQIFSALVRMKILRVIRDKRYQPGADSGCTPLLVQLAWVINVETNTTYPAVRGFNLSLTVGKPRPVLLTWRRAKNVSRAI